jgi:hypothetical protein
MSGSGIDNLVQQFSRHFSEYKSDAYNETEVRAEFIDPFFRLLGWDVTNERIVSRRFREVIREVNLPWAAGSKRPDYEFRLGVERRFFVEAKKPSVDIVGSAAPAFQVRRYGWSAGLQVSVLTNFEYLAIYDTTAEPSPAQSANHARRHLFHYTDYPARFDEIAALLSREAVYSGHFDEEFASPTGRRSREAIDAVFLGQLNRWRLQLGQDILAAQPAVDEATLNELAQRLILRVLFLRMCEDRGIANYELLKRTAAAGDWDAFVNLLIDSDRRYNSGLFDTRADPFCTPGPGGVKLSGATVQGIIDSLYFPGAPYDFSVFEPEFLGSVYEQFLRDRLVIRGDSCTLEPKPEHVGRDVVATPLDRAGGAGDALRPASAARCVRNPGS